MSRKILPLLFLLLALPLAQALTTCPTLAITSSQFLTDDYTSAISCFTVARNNLTIDCNGHTLTHTGSENGGHYGILSSGFQNLTIKNCIIQNFTGVRLSSARFATIINSSASSTQQVGFYATTSQDLQIINSSSWSFKNTSTSLSAAYRSNISNSTFYSSSLYALYFTACDNSTFFNNSAMANISYSYYGMTNRNINFSNSTSFTWGRSSYIRFQASYGSTFFGNTFTANNSYALYDYLGRNNTYRNNTVISPNYYGMYLGYSNFTLIDQLYANATAQPALTIAATNSTTVTHSNLTSRASYAFYTSTAFWTVLNDSTLTSMSSYGVYLLGGSGANFSNITVNGTAGYGFFASSSNNIIIQNSSIYTNVGTRRDVILYQSSNVSIYNSSIGFLPFAGTFNNSCNSQNNQLVNTTFNRSIMRWTHPSCGIIGEISNASVKWYTNFTTSTTNGSIIAANINVSYLINYFMSPPMKFEVFNQTTNAQGNYDGLVELTEFIAKGPFTYNLSAQPNYTTYSYNASMQAAIPRFVDNSTSRMMNQSFTPVSFTLAPVIPRIIMINISKVGPPYFATSVNDTTPYAIVSDIDGGLVNFTVVNASGSLIYFNQVNVSGNSSGAYIHSNFTTTIPGIYTVSINASNSYSTATDSQTFTFIDRTNIAACPFQTVPYGRYKVSGPLASVTANCINVTTGVDLQLQANINGVNALTCLVITGDNITISSNTGAFGCAGKWVNSTWINNTNNLTIRDMAFSGSYIALSINSSKDLYVANSSFSQAVPAAVNTIEIYNSQRVRITNISGSTSNGSILWVANSSSVSFANFFTDTANGVSSFVSGNDVNGFVLENLYINNVSTATSKFLTSPFTIVKCERCSYFNMTNTYLANATYGVNITDSNNTMITYGSLPNKISGITNTGLVVFSTSQYRSFNNTFYNYQVGGNTQKAAWVEAISGWSVIDTRFINCTFMPNRNIIGNIGFYSANATNTSIINSTVLYAGAAPLFATNSVKEATLATITGLQFLRLENTTHSLLGFNFSLGDNPNMTFSIGWGVEWRVNSSSLSTPLNFNASNLTGDILFSNTSANLNQTYWLGIFERGIANKTYLPLIMFNESNHTFNAAARYSSFNSTSIYITKPIFVEMEVNTDTTKGCGKLSVPITKLVQNITIDDPVCFVAERTGLVLDCDGYYLIANVQGVTGVNITGSASTATVRNCNFINSSTGTWAAAINSTAKNGQFYNNTFNLRGNASAIFSNTNLFYNSSGSLQLMGGDIGIGFGTAPAITFKNVFANNTFTATGTGGGILLYSASTAHGLNQQTLWIQNSTFRGAGTLERVFQVQDSIQSTLINYSIFYIDNTNDSSAIRLESVSGAIHFENSSIESTTDAFLSIGTATTVSGLNTSNNFTRFVIEAVSTWENDYAPIDVYMMVDNGTACPICSFAIEDVEGKIEFHTTGVDGYFRGLTLHQFIATSASSDELFLLNGVSQTNSSTDSNMTYYYPYIFRGLLTNYTGVNSTNIIAPKTVVILMRGSQTLDINFISQDPADIDTFNALGGGVNITYDVTYTAPFNTSSFLMFYKINNTETEKLIYSNGSVFGGWANETYLVDADPSYIFQLLDNQIYPGDYNKVPSAVERAPHNATTLTGQAQYALSRFMNFSTTKNFSVFEFMAYNTTVGASPLRIYYCNSTYVSGQVQISPYCAQFATLASGLPYNHTHIGGLSSHYVVPIGMNATGFIGTVKATDNSSFLIRGAASGNWNVSFVNNVSRTDAAQTSTNNGNAWTNLVGTYDTHLHQFSGNESVYYYVCGNLSSPDEMYGNCTPIRQDTLGLGGIAPSAPNIYSPTATTYANSVPINWTPAVSMQAAIVYYNVSLIYPNGTFVATIIANWSTNLNFTWDSSAYRGNYSIQVQAYDNQTVQMSSKGISEEFELQNCGNLTENSTLTQNVSFVDNICFYAGRANIVLDCAGYRIQSSGVNGTAFYSNYANSVLKNCIINSTATSSYAAGVLLSGGATDALIMNNTFQVIDNATRIMGPRTIFANNSVVSTLVDGNTIPVDVRATDVQIANSTIRFINGGYLKTITSDRFSISNSSILGSGAILMFGPAGAISTNISVTDSLLYSNDGTNSAAITITFARNVSFRNSNITQIKGINNVWSVLMERAYDDPVYFINTTTNRTASGVFSGFKWTVDGKGQNVSLNWLTNVKVIYDTGLPCVSCSINVTNRTNTTAIYNLVTDAAGYVYGLNLTEFMANGTYVYNGVPQLNYSVLNPYNFSANRTGYYGTNSTQINATGEVVILLNTLFSQTNTTWVQNTNITDYVEANWTFRVYVDGTGTVNVSLLMNRTGALWVQNASGNYVGFTNGSSWISWLSGTNVSQNWTITMQTAKMACQNITGMGWSTRQYAKLCVISQPNYPNTTVSVLLRNESQAQEIRTCQGAGTGPGNACDKTAAAVWIPTVTYTPIPGFIYRYGENYTLERYYMLLWDTVENMGGGGGEVPPAPVQNVTNETLQPAPTPGAQPTTSGLLEGMSGLYAFFKKNFWILIITGGFFVILDLREGKNDFTWNGRIGAVLIIIGAILAVGAA